MKTQTKPETLPVVFRQIDGETLALFPTLHNFKGSTYFVTCYAHVGQHGIACQDNFNRGKLSTETEYCDLLAELRGIYAPEYNLQPRKKRTATR
jgi:hypothetical protein